MIASKAFNEWWRFWRDLYENDPEAADELKEKILEETLQKGLNRGCVSPPERTLRGTIFRIRAAREISKNPDDSFLTASQMMWDMFDKPGGLRDAIHVIAGKSSSELILEEANKLNSRRTSGPADNNNVIRLDTARKK